MPVSGADIVGKNIIAFGGGFRKYVDKTMGEAKVILDKKITDNISLTDHTQADLRREGHPYSRRNYRQIHTPYYQVHKQKGTLLSSKISGVNSSTILGGTLRSSAYVALDPSVAKHARFVVYGTSKMIPRPVLQGSLDEVSGEIRTLLGSRLKDFVVNFKGASR